MARLKASQPAPEQVEHLRKGIAQFRAMLETSYSGFRPA
jgi:hypothetical protein